MAVKVGQKVPKCSGPNQAGELVELGALSGQNVVLYFYPHDNTETCTKQACQWRDSYDVITKSGARLMGVSPDSERTHKGFAAKYSLNFELLADPELKICKAFDVWQEKTVFGQTGMGVVRSTFVIDKKGIIRAIFSNIRLKGHIEEVLDVLRSLS